jgi:hypothetical protein
MDGNHAFGCTLIGLALTTLLVRIVYASSPRMSGTAGSVARTSLAAVTAALLASGVYLLSLPVDLATLQRISEASYRFR